MTNYGELMRFIHEVALLHTGDECLIWPFGKNTSGYGKLRVGGKLAGAHRYVCELAHGAPPTREHDAAHSCGNGHDACVSPIHLGWKTKAENCADKLEHGTHSRGERNGNAKLTEPEAREILALKAVEPKSKLAKRFGISGQTVGRIHNEQSWSWLSEGNAA